MQKLKCNLFGSERCSPTLGFLLTLACFFSHSFASAQTDTTTIAGLRSMTSASTTRNYFITDPGKQGLWRYDQADNSSRDNTGTIAVSSSGLRFKRIYTGPIHVTWFGCIGDGSFDNTDTLEFIFANFTQIHIPSGIYKISISRLDNRNEPDNIDRGINLRAGTVLSGDGNTVSVIKQSGVINDLNSTYYGALRVAWVNNVTIRDIGIYGENRPMVPTNTLSEAKGLVVYGTASNILVERCRFQWIFGHGILDIASLGKGGNTYRSCIGSYNSKNAFNLSIPYLVFTDNYGEGNSFSLLEAACGNGLIANNVAKNNLICGIAVGGFTDTAGPPNQGKFNVVRNNICSGNGLEGLRITAGTSNSEVYDNICFKNGQAGIIIHENIATYPGIYTRNNNVYKNFCYSNGISGSPSPIGMQVSAPYNNIYNNLLVDSASPGYKQVFGMLVSPNISNFNRIYGNKVVKNTLFDYYFQTYTNLYFNNNESSSIVTINGGGGFSGSTFNWSQVSGPNSAIIQSPNLVSTRVSGLTNGVYRFRLSSPSKTDSVTLQILPLGPSAPVAIAGPDLTIFLPENFVDLNGQSSFDPNGSISGYSWVQIEGPSSASMSGTGAVVSAGSLLTGVYKFKLEVKSNSGLIGNDTITVKVLPRNPNNAAPTAIAGKDQVITLPINTVTLNANSSYDADGFISSFRWSQIEGPSISTIGSPSLARTIVSGLSQGIYKFKIDISDNLGVLSSDTMRVIVNSASSVNQPPVAIAGPDIMIAKASYTESALLDGSKSYDNDGIISSYVWTQISGPNTAGSTSPFVSITDVFGFVKGVYVFSLKVTDNLGASSMDTVVVAVEVPLPVQQPTNRLPIARAGSDKILTLPTSSAVLDGSLSSDSDGNIVSFSWIQLLGPNSARINSSQAAITNIDNLTQGVYRFRLVVTDNSGATGADTVSVTVNAAPPPPPAPNRLPVAIAGADQSVRFPINFVALNGNASFDPDGAITSYSWSQISGPGNASIAAPFSASTVVNGLVAGVYSFRLEVKDNSGAIAADTVMVRVQLFQPPIPVAPDTLMVKMPVESVELDGSKSYDPDGSIAAFSWTFVQGPNTPLINAQANPVAKVRNLVEGAYVFTLTLTNDKGLSASKNVKVIVSNSNNRLAIKTLSVYPNPVSGTNATLQLEGDYNDKIYMDIYDLNGRVVSRQEFIKNVPSFRQIIYVSHLTNGLYVVQLRTLMRVLGTVKFQKY